MAIITTGSFQLPDNLYNGIWKKIQDGSVIAKLAQSEGFKYGNTDIMTFSDPPKAEWVAEHGNKSSTVPTWNKKTVQTHKAQVTVRMTNEVLIMDEDRQIEALKTVVDSLGVALARALDLGGIHGLNPLTGTSASSITDYIRAQAATMAATSGKPRKDLDDAGLALLSNDWVPTGLALAPTYAYQFKIAEYPDGRRMFPELPLNVRNIGSVDGIAAAISDTVSASKEAATATNVLGVMGNWDAFKWGIIRNIPLETILYGDPDGQGDLKRTNEIAIRAEIYYAWAVMDPTAFEVITAATQSAGNESH